MIRLALFSQDLKLQPLLAPALGRDFQVIAEPDGDRLKQLLWDGSFDVLLLDLDTDLGNVEQQLEFFDKISESGVAVVVMTDDAARPTAMDLVQRGAHSYCRKPPALRELKATVRRGSEHAAMKRELEGKRAGNLAQLEREEPLK